MDFLITVQTDDEDKKAEIGTHLWLLCGKLAQDYSVRINVEHHFDEFETAPVVDHSENDE